MPLKKRIREHKFTKVSLLVFKFSVILRQGGGADEADKEECDEYLDHGAAGEI
jgi:hypothetical protein